jgi:hypothetical protein
MDFQEALHPIRELLPGYAAAAGRLGGERRVGDWCKARLVDDVEAGQVGGRVFASRRYERGGQRRVGAPHPLDLKCPAVAQALAQPRRPVAFRLRQLDGGDGGTELSRAVDDIAGDPELSVAFGERCDDIGVRFVLAGARLVGQIDERVGTVGHRRDQAVIADGDIEEGAHAVAVMLQRFAGIPCRPGVLGIAHDGSKPLQIEAGLLGIAEEELVVARPVAARGFQEIVAGGARRQEVAVNGAGQHGAAAGAVGLVQQHKRGERDCCRDGDRNAADQEDAIGDAHEADRARLCRAGAHPTRAGWQRGRCVGVARNAACIGQVVNRRAGRRRPHAADFSRKGRRLRICRSGREPLSTRSASRRTGRKPRLR